MARLEAIAKALYYPTPDRVVGMIGNVVQLTDSAGAALLDPCAGEGRAAAILAHRWNVIAHGIELHKGRADTAAQVLSWAKHGSYHQLSAVNNKGEPISPDGYSPETASRPFGILFLNPPYDEGTDENGASLRQEIEFLRATTRFLAPGGLLVFIPPRKLLKVEAFRECMRRNYRGIRVHSFPEPEIEAFDQIVVFARRNAYGYSDISVFDEEFTSLDTAESYQVNVPVVTARVALIGRAPETYEPSENEGAWAAQQWVAHTGEGAEHELAPLVSPRPGHQAMLLAAGALNGLELSAGGDRLLVKGGSRKVVTVIESQEETIHRERITSYLSVLNLTSGSLDSWQVEDDQTKTGDWFKSHGDELATGILAAHAPQFNSKNLEAYDFSKLCAPGILPGRTEPEILQVQRETSAAIVHRWFGGARSNRRIGHKEVILCGEMGTGKLQPVTEPVLTPTGWVPIGQLKVGDLVTDPDTGGTTEVVGVFPQGNKPVYRCTFTDGSSTLCGDEHLWEVQTPLRKWRGRPARVIPLEKIRISLAHVHGNYQHYIPLTQPVVFSEVVLPIPPYTLGALLGDGCMVNTVIRLTSADSVIPERLASELPEAVVRHPRRYEYRILSPGLPQALRQLNLIGCRSWQKHIPDIYLRASIAQREAILQGLLDTDGTVGKNSSTIEYCTTSPMLARDVAELVQSLGGTVVTIERTTYYTYKGKRCAGRLSYRVMIALPNEIKPFYLPRKAARLVPRTKYPPTRAFKTVEPAGEAECVCIKVANPRGLYITKDYIVTHNTTMAVIATELARAKKVVVVCPTHLVPKWVREIETVTGRRGSAIVPKKLSDVDAFFASTKTTYLVLSKETAKLGARWESACAKGSKVITREVKKSIGDSYFSYRTVSEIVAERRKFDACSACGAEVLVDKKTQSKCKECREPLYQFTTISTKGTKRWPLAAYIHSRYTRRYTLVVDEAHQHAKGETDQARAVHQMITGAKKVLMMTGTLYGGRASSIFHLLFRLDPAFRRAYKQTDCATFVEHHGLFETVHKEEERTSTYGYRKGNSGGRIREIPGMSPAMIPMLLPYTVFVKLRDLKLELPAYTEEVLLVEPDPKVLKNVSKFQGELKALIRKHPKVLGAYLQACLGYPDRPDQSEAIYDVDDEGERTELLASMPATLGDSWPKDEALIELVRKEHAVGRKVLVFFTQTKRRDARPRVREALEASGLRVVQLDSNVAPEKREEWMRDQCEIGFDVMLTNGRLVETGLDLIFANTIVQYGIEYSINTLRQSIRRSWRLGQNKPVRVIFMAYRGTMQAIAIDLIARKMRAAELVDGDATGGLAQFDVGGGNFLLELAHEVLEIHASRAA